MGWQVERRTPVSRQIQDYVRGLIAGGELVAGARLPSTEELARRWSANVGTVHSAMHRLSKEGLIVRIPNRGTYVTERPTGLRRIGFYCTGDIFSDPMASFPRAVYAALETEVRRRKGRIEAWIDPRPVAEQDTPWDELLDAVRARQLDALAQVNISARQLEWTSRLPIPTSHLGSHLRFPGRVSSDFRQLLELGLKRLAERGCRTFGLIAPIGIQVRETGNLPDELVDPHQGAVRVAARLGMATRPEWCRWSGVGDGDHPEGSDAGEEYGYRSFCRLWSRRERPDGLIVWHDFVAKGALMAVATRGARVPGELKLVLYRNDDVPFFCPLEADFLVSNVREHARGLLTQIERQAKGEPCPPLDIPHRIFPSAIKAARADLRPARRAVVKHQPNPP